MDAKTSQRKPQILIALGCAAGLTAILFIADLVRLNRQDTEECLKLSRQIVSQIESLTSALSEK